MLQDDIRKSANDFLELLAEPALEKYGFLVTRADRIAHPTAITTDIVRLVQEADLCLIDLTNSNANVFYECGRRHESGKPFIQMIQKGQEASMPFDVAGIRTVVYDLSSPRAVRESIIKLQDFIDPLVASGFRASTGGESLSSVAQSVERIERKLNQLLSTSQSGPSEASSMDDVFDLMKPPRELFFAALKKGNLDVAFSLLDKLKRMLPADDYATVLSIPVAMGHAKSFERLDGELNALLKNPAFVQEHDELLKALAEGAKKYFENTGQLEEGLKYLEGLCGNIVGVGTFGDEAKAFVANKVGMLAWVADKYDACIKYTKIALTLNREPSYFYNLALVYTKEKMEEELADTLKQLALMPDLDEDHKRLLRRHGYAPAG